MTKQLSLLEFPEQDFFPLHPRQQKDDLLNTHYIQLQQNSTINRTIPECHRSRIKDQKEPL